MALRIGMLTTSYPRSDGDAAGAFVRGMACALAARGHTLEVLAPRPRERSAPPRDDGVALRWVSYAPSALERTFYGAGVPDNVRDPLAWPGLAGFPVALTRQASRSASGWDAVISHWALPCGLVAAGVRGRRPHLAVFHSADVHLMRRLPGRGRIAAGLARGSSAMLFSSAALREEVLSWMRPKDAAHVAGRAHAHAMGVALEAPSGDRRALRRTLGLGRFSVLALARLVPVKGLGVLVRALAGTPDAHLLIAGEGPERDALVSLARQHDVRLDLLGHVGPQRKADLLHACHAYALPSVKLASGRTEGTPTALLEAATAGLPIVASDVGGVGEVLTHDRSALLVPPNDPNALRAALTSLREDRNLRRRLGRAAQTAARPYAWPQVAEMLEALLDAH